MAQTAEYVFRDFTTDGVPSSGANKVKKADVREWGAYLETVALGALAGSAVFGTKAQMDGQLGYDGFTMAWVVADPVAANNGIYRKSGASGTGSWLRLGDLPYSFIKASNAGAGTANAIVATTAVPIPEADGAALIALNITANNTADVPTVAFNGEPALTIIGVDGSSLVAGDFGNIKVVHGYKVGSTFQLMTDVASLRNKQAAEAAATAALAIAQSYEDLQDAVGQAQQWAEAAAEIAVPAGSIDTGKISKEFIHSGSPFGRSGVKVIVGAEYDAHNGFGGPMRFASGKWVQIYRKASDHATTNGAELRARDTYDKGNTWENDRLILSDPACDARPDAPRIMANNRGGFFLNRAAVGGGAANKYPLFIKTDDEGVTFVTTEVPTTSLTYTFQGHSGLMDYPASQGGHDTLGFITFGFIDAGGLDAFTTADNGETWSIVSDVANVAAPITAISESMGFRVGSQDKWIFFSRAQDAGGWRQMMTVWVTTDIKNWGTPLDAGVDLFGNPPGGLYDAATNKWHMLNFGRGGRGINGFDHHLLHIEVDADDLFNANGSFSALGLNYSVLTPVPSWATGYIAPFKDGDAWYATFTCGEPGTAGGNRGAVALIGDFVPRAADTMKLVDFLMRRQMEVRSLEMHADDNVTTTYPLIIRNASKTAEAKFGAYGLSSLVSYTFKTTANFIVDAPATLFGGLTAPISGVTAAIQGNVGGATLPVMATTAGGTTAREHFIFINANGKVGSISTSGTATAFNTSSDEAWKDFIGKYDPLRAIDIIRRDPVREWHWDEEHGGGYAVGWGAQTSYAVSSDLATPGGWFDAAGNECEPEAEGAVYVPWGVDQSKRTPYLWAALTWALDKIDDLERRLAALEG